MMFSTVFCTDHAHTGSGDPGFGVIVLVHKQLSIGVPHNQLVQLQRKETDSTFTLYERKVVFVCVCNHHYLTTLTDSVIFIMVYDTWGKSFWPQRCCIQYKQ